MKKIIKKILAHHVIKEKPPVLIDIGASGSLPDAWKLIAPYSICMAFDADTRDFSVTESSNKGFKKLFMLNRLVSVRTSDEVNFYLTKSAHCSSLLVPDHSALKPWCFNGFFEVNEIARLPAVNLYEAMQASDIDYIDWYKSDSQGVDLRIFNSLSESLINAITIAEFEPGIIDAYVGEDKLHHLLKSMDDRPFWISSMKIKGSCRIEFNEMSKLNFLQRRMIGAFLKNSPGWCEISYINKFEGPKIDLREILLGWVFSTIKGEHGFALQIAKKGKDRFHEPLFDEMINTSRASISSIGSYLKCFLAVTTGIFFRIKKRYG